MIIIIQLVKDLIRKYKKDVYFIVFTFSKSDRYDDIKEILEKENLPYDAINDDATLIYSEAERYIIIFY